MKAHSQEDDASPPRAASSSDKNSGVSAEKSTAAREYVRIVPGPGTLDPEAMVALFIQLHQLGASGTWWRRWLPERVCSPPTTYEFAIVAGAGDGPVEYLVRSTDHGVETVAKQLARVYPASFGFERVSRDLCALAIEPGVLSRGEFVRERAQGNLYTPSLTGESAGAESESAPSGSSQSVTDGSSSSSAAGGSSSSGESSEEGTPAERGSASLPAPIDERELADVAPASRGTAERLVGAPAWTDERRESVRARPAMSGTSPVSMTLKAASNGGHRVYQPWAYSGARLSNQLAGEESRHPLDAVLAHLSDAKFPVVLQLVASPKPNWERAMARKKRRLETGQDVPLWQRVVLGVGRMLDTPREAGRSGRSRGSSRQSARADLSGGSTRAEGSLVGRVDSRLQDLDAKNPARSFDVAVRGLSVPADAAGAEQAAVLLNTLGNALAFGGDRAAITHTVYESGSWWPFATTPHSVVEAVETAARPSGELVLDPDELGVLATVPGASDLGPGARGVTDADTPGAPDGSTVPGGVRDRLAEGVAFGRSADARSSGGDGDG